MMLCYSSKDGGGCSSRHACMLASPEPLTTAIVSPKATSIRAGGVGFRLFVEAYVSLASQWTTRAELLCMSTVHGPAAGGRDCESTRDSRPIPVVSCGKSPSCRSGMRGSVAEIQRGGACRARGSPSAEMPSMRPCSTIQLEAYLPVTELSGRYVAFLARPHLLSLAEDCMF